MNVNFRDKNFMMATFIRDYLRAVVPMRTIHVALPTILTRGIGACKRKTNRNNAEPFRQRLSIRLDALVGDTYRRLLTFVICLLLKNIAGTPLVLAAQHVTMPTMSIPNIREENFRD